MSAVLRICVVLCMAHLAGCDSILGIHEIIPDEPPGDPTEPPTDPTKPPTDRPRPTTLAFVSVPSKAIAQRPLGAITVVVQDILGRPVNSSGKEITLSLRDARGTAHLLGTRTAMVVSDTASFDNVVVDRPGPGYTLVASGDSLMPATSPLDVLGTFTLLPTSDGGFIDTITVSPAPPGGTTTLFAAAGNGVYTSRDGGMTWTASGIGGDVEFALVVADPQHPGVAYLAPQGYHDYILLKTEDGGVSWRAAGSSSQSVVFWIAIDPKDSSTVYAVYLDAQGRRLLRSTDGGTSWNASGLPGECSLIEIDPITTSNLYCGGSTDGIYKSSNTGVSWVNTGLGGTAAWRIVATPDALFANVGGDYYRSTDGAASWTRVPGTAARELAYAPSMPRRIYLWQSGAVLVSNDAGASFGVPIPFRPEVRRFAVHPTNPDIVYAATHDGLFISTNAGASWSLSSRGISAVTIHSVAQVPGTTGALLASTPAAVVRSTNGGGSWTTVAEYPGNIVFDSATPTTAYLCGDGRFAISTDSGANFSASASLGVDCNQLAIAESTFFAAGLGHLRKSTNRGVTWTDTGISDAAFAHAVALGDGVGNVVLVGSGTAGLYRSTNGGASFTQVSAIISPAVFTDPQVPSHVLASGYDPASGCLILLSTDGGATFNRTASWCADNFSAAGSVLYASGIITSNGADGLYSSTDRGQTWAPVPLAGSVPDGLNIMSVTVSDDGTLYLGTSSGLYKSFDH